MAIVPRQRPLTQVPAQERRNVYSYTMALAPSVIEETVTRLRAAAHTNHTNTRPRVFHRHVGGVSDLSHMWTQPCTDQCVFVDWIEDGKS